MSVIIKLLSKFDDSGLKKAKSGFGGLSKTLGAVGIGFGIKAITDGLLDAAKAAAADEKSTRLLNIQLIRNAGATKESVKENDQFIESLSLATGIMDDDLRPSMAKFANVTGNVKDAQKLLTITLDGAAGSGKNQEKIANAVAKAYAGNTTSLKKMFPELTKSKDVLGDFAKTYKGLAEENADPFMKFNNSMDILKEKLGVVVLPILIDFIDEISKPGGAIEVVGKFFDDLANPKTEAGQTFNEIKDAIGEVIESVKTFFGYFGNGDAVQGFANIATALVKALPALLALKGIMMLASAGKAIQSLITAMTVISGKNSVSNNGTTVIPGSTGDKNTPKKSKFKTNVKGAAGLAGIFALTSGGDLVDIGVGIGSSVALNSPVGRTAATVLTLGGDSKLQTPEELAQYHAQKKIDSANFKKYSGRYPGLPQRPVTNNFNITVTNQDPKATVDAIGKYVKQNGSLPNWAIPGKKP
jgi:hypothetical protein